MSTFFRWLIVSSSNPEKISLTVKAFLGGLVIVITAVCGLAGIHVGDLTPLVDPAIAIIQAVLGLVSAAAFFYGLVRKVILTARGEHAGLQ